MRDDPYNERSGQDFSSQIGASTKLGAILVLFQPLYSVVVWIIPKAEGCLIIVFFNTEDNLDAT